MKKGDVATIYDCSYSMVVTNHGLESGEELPSVKNEQGIVIETNCKFPNPHKYQDQRHEFNNTVVRTDSGKVVFIEERFLRLVEPTHKVIVDVVFQSGCGGYGVVDGEVVEISDKLYKEIKKS